MVRNLHAGDLALIELHRSGNTDAPAEVLADLARRGHITYAAERASLTAERIRR